jgi:hypothetical protein
MFLGIFEVLKECGVLVVLSSSRELKSFGLNLFFHR